MGRGNGTAETLGDAGGAVVPVDMTRAEKDSCGEGSSASSPVSRRNAWIDVCRVVASVIIMFFHYPVEACPVRFVSGALLVEYFFMLTGCFAIRHVDRHGDGYGEVYGYMRKFFLRVLPFVAVGVAIHFAADAIELAPDWAEVARQALLVPFEVMLLQSTNVYEESCHVMWYLSIAMICLPPVMWLYGRTRGKSWKYISAVAPLLCYGLAMEEEGTLRVNHPIVGTARRAFGGLVLGGLALSLSEWLGRRDLSKRKRALLLFAEVGALLLAGLLMTIQELEFSQYESVVVALLFVSLVISLSGVTPTTRIPSGRVAGWLGPVSLSIYCLHPGVFNLVRQLSGKWDDPIRILSAVVTVVLSVVLVGIVRKVSAIWRQRHGDGNAS